MLNDIMAVADTKASLTFLFMKTSVLKFTIQECILLKPVSLSLKYYRKVFCVEARVNPSPRLYKQGEIIFSKS